MVQLAAQFVPLKTAGRNYGISIHEFSILRKTTLRGKLSVRVCELNSRSLTRMLRYEIFQFRIFFSSTMTECTREKILIVLVHARENEITLLLFSTSVNSTLRAKREDVSYRFVTEPRSPLTASIFENSLSRDCYPLFRMHSWSPWRCSPAKIYNFYSLPLFVKPRTVFEHFIFRLVCMYERARICRSFDLQWKIMLSN